MFTEQIDIANSQLPEDSIMAIMECKDQGQAASVIISYAESLPFIDQDVINTIIPGCVMEVEFNNFHHFVHEYYEDGTFKQIWYLNEGLDSGTDDDVWEDTKDSVFKPRPYVIENDEIVEEIGDRHEYFKLKKLDEGCYISYKKSDETSEYEPEKLVIISDENRNLVNTKYEP